MSTVTQLFPADLREDEATRLRRDLETYRSYLAGPCDRSCKVRGGYDGHRHWTPWYEQHRSIVVTLNSILDADYPRETWRKLAETVDPDEDACPNATNERNPTA